MQRLTMKKIKSPGLSKSVKKHKPQLKLRCTRGSKRNTETAISPLNKSMKSRKQRRSTINGWRTRRSKSFLINRSSKTKFKSTRKSLESFAFRRCLKRHSNNVKMRNSIAKKHHGMLFLSFRNIFLCLLSLISSAKL